MTETEVKNIILNVKVILVWSLITFKSPTYGSVEYPVWGLGLGWCMALFVVLWIPGIALYKIFRAEGTLWQVHVTMHSELYGVLLTQYSQLCSSSLQRLKSLCHPSEDWHPYLDVHRGERYSVEHCRSQNVSKPVETSSVNVIASSWL